MMLENGLLVKPGSSLALAKAILKLARSFEIRDHLGKNGKPFVSQNKKFYSWDAVGGKVL